MVCADRVGRVTSLGGYIWTYNRRVIIAAQVHIDAAQLYQYAMSDTLGGYHIDESQRRWPMGSLWGVEGQILYALVRILKPRRVVQIGGWVGCSAMHLA